MDKNLYTVVLYLIFSCTRILGVTLSTVVLSIRIRKELKEEAIKLGIDLRSVVEKALEEEIKRIKKERLRSVVEEGLNSMNISDREWVETVKESRKER